MKLYLALGLVCASLQICKYFICLNIKWGGGARAQGTPNGRSEYIFGKESNHIMVNEKSQIFDGRIFNDIRFVVEIIPHFFFKQKHYLG